MTRALFHLRLLQVASRPPARSGPTARSSVRCKCHPFGVADLGVALAGGAVGAVIAGASAQAARARAAWSDVSLHDEEARERNAQLAAWVDDRTQNLVREMARRTGEFNSKGLLYSGGHGVALASAKADALHEYRDEEWRTRLDLARLRATEGPWHRWWRWLRRREAPRLTTDTHAEIEWFLGRWREAVTRHGSAPADAVVPFDRTQRTTAEAIAELPTLKLT
jgi:hypothetical protein